MRIPRLTHCLLALVCTLTGCTQTGGFRSAAAGNSNPNIRTVASVGDKPIPIVTGEPGLSERAETAEVDLPPSSGARISGRVFDDRGRPVPNATVRLAAGSAPSGKASYATTDRSGAFTLRGLRAGSSYTVIAEYDGQRGAMSGRMEAQAPDTNVHISLRSRDNEPDEPHSTIRPAKVRLEPNSDDDEGQDPDDRAGMRSRSNRFNSEDLEPPAAEATSMLPRRGRSASTVGATTEDELPPMRAGWNPQRRPQDDNAGSKPNRSSRGDSGSKRGPAEQAGDEDEGPNPLPPALEAGGVGSTFPGDSGDDPPLKIARNPSRQSSRADRLGDSAASGSDGRRSGATDRRSTDRGPQAMPDDVVPKKGEIRPDSFAPIRADDVAASGSDDADSRPAPRPRRRNTSRSAETRSSRPAGRSDDETTADPRASDDSASRGNDRGSARVASAPEARRPTWRDVSMRPSNAPRDESVQLAANVTETQEEKAATPAAPAKAPASQSRFSFLQRLTGSKPPAAAAGATAAAAAAASQAFCRIDPTDRRLVALRLPDLEGKTVSLDDFNSDLVLLDFWGSWCKECRTSIPHLIDVQTKYGENRLRVIGIACERGSKPEDRLASAAKAARGLKINYPVLVAAMDGTCPVQQGMQVHFYPTMILLDRSGRILRREQGATDATLTRIDRAIERALKE